MKVLLFVNARKDRDGIYTDAIRSCLIEKQIEHSVFVADNDKSTIKSPVLDGIDIVVVLGGDGTVLHGVREVSKKGLPVVGVNIGRLGFLTEVDYQDFCDALDKIIACDYILEKRMLLKATTKYGGEALAVNDVCVSNKERGKIVWLSIYVNGEFVEKFAGDGIIVSSPTGSTGYSMSAGGPIVAPTANCMILTPVCAHSLVTKPMVLTDTDKVTIKIEEEKTGLAVIDGQTVIETDEILVQKNEYGAKFIRFKEYNFFDVLSRKFNNNIK